MRIVLPPETVQRLKAEGRWHDILEDRAPAAPRLETPAAPEQRDRGPNKTEQQYRDLYLEPRLRSGELVRVEFEALVFRIGPPRERCSYRPDFAAVTRDGLLELHEVKGAKVWDDARAKFLAAVRIYPEFPWTWARYVDRRWEIETHGRPPPPT